MSWSVNATPVFSHSGKYCCSDAFAVSTFSRSGSQKQPTVVMPAFWSCGMRVAACVVIDEMSGA